MSQYSPGPVASSEILARFVFAPVHVRRNGNLKPSIFSHVSNKGCSIQRESMAGTGEMVGFVEGFLGKNETASWVGLITGKCEDVRQIRFDGSMKSVVCVYDTGNVGNPAHGELCQTHYVIEEADRIELRGKLLRTFNDGRLIGPAAYREGEILCALATEFRERVSGG